MFWVLGPGLAVPSFAQPGPSGNFGQVPNPSMAGPTDPALLQDLAASANQPKPDEPKEAGVQTDVVSLLVKGGWFMVPIGIVSLVALAFALERFIGLRSAKLLPSGLVRGLTQLARESESIDPRAAYPLCLKHPSAAANVVRAVLTRAGRPLSELETLASETCQREADRAYGGVRWLHFAAGVAPLLGLLGTIWGLIQAFHDMTLLSPTQNRAEFLGRGIYIALVTTLAGLVVAIPAALAAHWYEGRISRIFGRIEELVSALITRLEKYEGRFRFDIIGREMIARPLDTPVKRTSSSSSSGESSKPVAAPPVQTVTFPGSPPHTNPPAPQRKTIYKP
jgi:biopolymer transport protein ExbB